eukprot:jgi/Botrbrau1/5155/Bobra.0172s0027.1
MGSVLPALPTRRTGVQIPLEKRRKKNKLGDMGRNEEARRYKQVGLRKMGDTASGGSGKLRRNPI